MTPPLALALSPQPPPWPRRILAPELLGLGVLGSVVVYELLRRLRKKGPGVGTAMARGPWLRG